MLRSLLTLSLLATVVIAGCTSGGDDSSDGGGTDEPGDVVGPGDPPAQCNGRPILDAPPQTWEDCGDSVACYVDAAGAWQVVVCDPPLPDACDVCTSDEVCVQRFDGTCGLTTACVPATVSCPANACSPECEAAYCGAGPYQCANRAPCGTESPAAFTCYGP